MAVPRHAFFPVGGEDAGGPSAGLPRTGQTRTTKKNLGKKGNGGEKKKKDKRPVICWGRCCRGERACVSVGPRARQVTVKTGRRSVRDQTRVKQKLKEIPHPHARRRCLVDDPAGEKGGSVDGVFSAFISFAREMRFDIIIKSLSSSSQPPPRPHASRFVLGNRRSDKSCLIFPPRCFTRDLRAHFAR